MHLNDKLCWLHCVLDPGLMTAEAASARARRPSPNAAIPVTTCQAKLIEAWCICQTALQQSQGEAELTHNFTSINRCWSGAATVKCELKAALLPVFRVVGSTRLDRARLFYSRASPFQLMGGM